MQVLLGQTFDRKKKPKQSTEDAPTKYSLDVSTSSGLMLLHLYDWAWEEKIREGSINSQLAMARSGCLFVYDVGERRSKEDFDTQMNWYAMAAGFDKPIVIISNKNDQKKHSVREEEGQALARQGDRRGFVQISLADPSMGGVDEVVLTTLRILLGDANLSLTAERSYGPASADSLAWSAAMNSTEGIGMSMDDLSATKTKRALLVVLNSSVAEKFNEMAALSEYVIEPIGSVALCAEEIQTPAEGDAALPVVAIVVPPTASASQKKALTELAELHHIAFVVSVPRNVVNELREGGA